MNIEICFSYVLRVTNVFFDFLFEPLEHEAILQLVGPVEKQVACQIRPLHAACCAVSEGHLRFMY